MWSGLKRLVALSIHSCLILICPWLYIKTHPRGNFISILWVATSMYPWGYNCTNTLMDAMSMYPRGDVNTPLVVMLMYLKGYVLTHSWLLCQYNPGFANTALGATVKPRLMHLSM